MPTPALALPSTPDTGDIVIRPTTRADGFAFVLRPAFGPDQYFVKTRTAAISAAMMCAGRAGTRAWLANASDTQFVLLEGEPARPATRRRTVLTAVPGLPAARRPRSSSQYA